MYTNASVHFLQYTTLDHTLEPTAEQKRIFFVTSPFPPGNLLELTYFAAQYKAGFNGQLGKPHNTTQPREYPQQSPFP